MGKVKIAQILCRAGLHLGSTTVGRMLKEFPATPPDSASSPIRVVTAKQPNHVWHVDLTAGPTGIGLWAPWAPFALPQCWPFCWEPREHWQRCSPCAKPIALVAGKPDARFTLVVNHHAGHSHLPVVSLQRAA